MSEAKARSPYRRWLMRIGRSALIIYLVVVLVFAALQSWMIFPGAATQGHADAVVGRSDAYELVELKSPEGQRIAAVFGKALTASGEAHPQAQKQPTILWFYGNGMCMANCLDEFERLRRLGNNVCIPEFLGYGMSEGKPSEAGVYQTAQAAWDYLMSRGDVEKSKVIVAGWSLGSAAAIELAVNKPVAGLMVFSAFTSMKEMARRVVPWAPTGLMLRHHFENEAKIKRIKAPILIMHGSVDSIVPFDMSARLAKAAPHAEYVPIEAADHNDLFEVGGEAMYERIGSFIESVVK